MMRSAVSALCAQVASDPLLVQGAGGNASWKEGDVLWVKASGTWLAHALTTDIFVPVNLVELKRAVASGDYGVSPEVRGRTALRPSIETLLHAIMPHRVVVHLHAVDVLAQLVRVDAETIVRGVEIPGVCGAYVAYHRPGAGLAEAVAGALQREPGANVLYLQSHGVVIGGDSVAELQRDLNAVLDAFGALADAGRHALGAGAEPPALAFAEESSAPWQPVDDPELHCLATDPVLFEHLSCNWALYPDHLVFLGARALTLNSRDELAQWSRKSNDRETGSDFVFVRDFGVFSRGRVSDGKLAQLRCYFDVLVRQRPAVRLATLGDAEVAALLNWDAERYRMQIEDAQRSNAVEL